MNMTYQGEVMFCKNSVVFAFQPDITSLIVKQKNMQCAAVNDRVVQPVFLSPKVNVITPT